MSGKEKMIISLNNSFLNLKEYFKKLTLVLEKQKPDFPSAWELFYMHAIDLNEWYAAKYRQNFFEYKVLHSISYSIKNN